VAGAVGCRSEIANGGVPQQPLSASCPAGPAPRTCRAAVDWRALRIQIPGGKPHLDIVLSAAVLGRAAPNSEMWGYPWDLYPDRCLFPCSRSVLRYQRPLKAGCPLAIGRSQTLRLQTSLRCSPERSGSARSGWTNSGSTIARCRSTSGGTSRGPVPVPRFRRGDEGTPANALWWRTGSARSVTENVRAWDPTAWSSIWGLPDIDISPRRYLPRRSLRRTVRHTCEDGPHRHDRPTFPIL
jgi:hypothetical protein